MFNWISNIRPELVVEGGSVIALLYFMYLDRQKTKDFSKIITNHLNHDLVSREELTKALQKLTDAIENGTKQ